MRYLRKFNESFSKVHNLEEFCENYLAHLLDDGFKFKVETADDAGMLDCSYLITFAFKEIIDYNMRYDDEHEFTWSEIKDTFIPFVTMLNNSYNIFEIYFNITKATQNFTVNIDSLIADEIDDVIKDSENYYDDLPLPLGECEIYKIEITIK